MEHSLPKRQRGRLANPAGYQQEEPIPDESVVDEDGDVILDDFDSSNPSNRRKELPCSDDALCLCLQFLSFKAVCVLSSVNRRWRTLCQSPAPYRKVILHPSTFDGASGSVVATVCQRFSRIKVLKISDSFLAVSQLSLWVSSLRVMRSVNPWHNRSRALFAYCYEPLVLRNSDTLEILEDQDYTFSHFPELPALKILTFNYSLPAFILSTLSTYPKLEAIDMSNSINNCPKRLARLFTIAPNIRFLSLRLPTRDSILTLPRQLVFLNVVLESPDDNSITMEFDVDEAQNLADRCPDLDHLEVYGLTHSAFLVLTGRLQQLVDLQTVAALFPHPHHHHADLSSRFVGYNLKGEIDWETADAKDSLQEETRFRFVLSPRCEHVVSLPEPPLSEELMCEELTLPDFSTFTFDLVD